MIPLPSEIPTLFDVNPPDHIHDEVVQAIQEHRYGITPFGNRLKVYAPDGRIIDTYPSRRKS